jgi:hypothetical protein
VESSSECGNEPSGSIRCRETIEWLHNSVVLSSIESVKSVEIRTIACPDSTTLLSDVCSPMLLQVSVNCSAEAP